MQVTWDAFSNSTFLKYLLIVLGTFLLGIIVSKILHSIIRRLFNPQLLNSENIDRTTLKFLQNGISFVVFLTILIYLFLTIPQLKNVGVTLFAGAGILAAIIGFASQAAFSNIISGIFIVIFKPFRVGDIITVGTSNSGIVEDITLRHSVIRNFENRRVIIPNSIISADTILNSSITDEKVCLHIEVSVAYTTNIEKARSIFREVIEAHHFHIDARSQEEIDQKFPETLIRVTSLDASSVCLRANAWASNAVDGFQMKCDVLEKVLYRFNTEGVEIPYPYQNIILKNELKE